MRDARALSPLARILPNLRNISLRYDGSDELDIDADATQPGAVNANRFLWQMPFLPTPAAANKPEKASAYFNGVNSAGIADAYSSCTLRLRYNITTSDFPGWPAEAMAADHPWKNAMVTAANNTNNGDDNADTPLQQDPYIYVSAANEDANGETTLDPAFVSLAVNTNQYARTFQDRSYTFKIKQRPSEASETDKAATKLRDDADEVRERTRPRETGARARARASGARVRARSL